MKRREKPNVEVLENGKRIDFLQFLINKCRRDIEGINIDLTGYNNLLDRLYNLDYQNPEEAWKLSLEANAWSEYLIGIKSALYMVLQDLETDKVTQIAKSSIEASPDKPTKGNRLANIDDKVVDIRKRRNHVETLYNLICDKIDILEKTHYFCKTTCEWNYRLLEVKNGRYTNYKR